MSYGGASGGASRISTASDAALSNPANGQALLYDASTQKWTNGAILASTTVTRTVTTATTLASNDGVVFVDPTSAAFTVTLPTAVGFSGRYTVTSTGSSSNVVTVATTSSQTIDGASTVTVGTQASGATYKSVDVVSNGSNWRIV